MAGQGRNELAVRGFLRSAGLATRDDPRAAAAVSAAVALDARWDAATSRELRQLQRELSEYVETARPGLPVPAADPDLPAPTSLVDRLRRPGRSG